MISLNKVLEIAIAGAPAAVISVLAILGIWFIRRLLQRITGFFRGEAQPERSEPDTTNRPMRIEPLLDSAAFTRSVEVDDNGGIRDLMENVTALARRVAALEERLALPPMPREPGHVLRIVKSDEGTPA